MQDRRRDRRIDAAGHGRQDAGCAHRSIVGPILLCAPSRGGAEESLLDGPELARAVVDALVDHQASDVVLLDLGSLTAFTDYFVVATAGSERQMRALVEAVDAVAGAHRGPRPRWEGRNEDGWRLADLGGAVVHVFSAEQRAYYDLEGLWRRAREVVHIQ